MRRQEVITAFRNILLTGQESKLSSILNSVARETEPKIPNGFDFIKLYETVQRLSRIYSENEYVILELFGLEDITKLNFWHEISTSRTRNRVTKLASLASNWNQFEFSAPHMVTLLTPDDSFFEVDVQTEFESQYVQLIISTSEEHLELNQIRALISAVESLHEIVCRLHDLELTPISMANCDSGTSFGFVFSTSKKAAGYIRSTIIEIWQHYITIRTGVEKSKSKLDVAQKAATVIEEIKSKEEKIGRESTEILVKLALEAVDDLIESRAIPPDHVKEIIEKSPELLEYTPQKLLNDKRKVKY